MKGDKFQCACCGKTFTKGRTEEKAYQECVENFGWDMADNDEMVEVCDDCYELIKPCLYPEVVASAQLTFEMERKIREMVKDYGKGVQDVEKYRHEFGKGNSKLKSFFKLVIDFFKDRYYTVINFKRDGYMNVDFKELWNETD